MLTVTLATPVRVVLCILVASVYFATAIANDADADGIDDNIDNCTLIANSGQRDTDGDQYGNLCDADLNGNLFVDFSDLALFRQAFSEQNNPDADFDGNGFVNFGDLAALRQMFGASPGPSGAAELDIALQLTPVFPNLSFTNPVALLQAPQEDSRWYVVEQAGTVRVFANINNAPVAPVFVDITDRVECCGEGGLLGMVFHPDYPNDPRVILSYTREGPDQSTPLVSILSEFTTPDGGASLDPGSERVLLTIDQPFNNHNGGHVGFGLDGYLYYGLGDGGAGGDPLDNAQNTSTLLGSILRIDINVSAQDMAEGIEYYIPEDNPFADSGSCATGCPELYAWGLRNPWRWSFDRQTGALWLGDVGQNAREEVDVIVKGGNYGWRCYEGNRSFKLSGCQDVSSYRFPVVDHEHPAASSLTGGFVYRGNDQPGLRGIYIYADFGTGRMWGINSASQTPLPAHLLDSGISPSSFGESESGELYVLDYYPGNVYRVDQTN